MLPSCRQSSGEYARATVASGEIASDDWLAVLRLMQSRSSVRSIRNSHGLLSIQKQVPITTHEILERLSKNEAANSKKNQNHWLAVFP